MRNATLRSGLVACALLLLPGTAFAEEFDFVLVNRTDREIVQVHVAPAGTNAWQPNGGDPEHPGRIGIVPRGRSTVVFSHPVTICLIDVRVTFADDTVVAPYRVNVCDYAYVFLSSDTRGVPVFSAN